MPIQGKIYSEYVLARRLPKFSQVSCIWRRPDGMPWNPLWRDPLTPTPTAPWTSNPPHRNRGVNHSQYADRIAQIVYDTEPKAPKTAKKKLTDTTWEHLLKATPELVTLLTCLVAF